MRTALVIAAFGALGLLATGPARDLRPLVADEPRVRDYFVAAEDVTKRGRRAMWSSDRTVKNACSER